MSTVLVETADGVGKVPQTFRGWRDGSLIVLPNAANVSSHCAKCNAPANGAFLNLPLAYVPAGYYLTLLAGLLIGAIIISLVTQRGEITVGLCVLHAADRVRLRRASLWLLLVWPVALAVLLAADDAVFTLVLLGVALIVSFVALGLWNHAVPVRARNISKGYLWLTGFGENFIAACPPVPPAPLADTPR